VSRAFPGHDVAQNALPGSAHSRSAQTLPVASASPGRFVRRYGHLGTVSGRRIRLIRSRIARNNRFGTATSATCLPAELLGYSHGVPAGTRKTQKPVP